MFEFLIDGVATFLSGYFSQKATTGKISTVKYFVIIFTIIFSAYLCYILTDFISSGILHLSIKKLFFALFVSLSASIILYFGVRGYKYYKRKNLDSV